ncbi:MAG: hypothetical protein C0407_00185 [Desulfobacca sp.]|nr:hypothetical protein [Desulfobacca sp.]
MIGSPSPQPSPAAGRGSLISFHPEIRISGWKHLDIHVNSRQKPFFKGFLDIDKACNCMFSSGKVVSG